MSKGAPSLRGAGWLRNILFRVGGPVCRWLFRLRVEGYEHVPQSGAAIIAANHLSFFDSVVLALAVPRRLSFVGKAWDMKADEMHAKDGRLSQSQLKDLEMALGRTVGR